MSTKQIDVTCPCCEARLVVDVRTEKVLKHMQLLPSEPSGFWVFRFFFFLFFLVLFFLFFDFFLFFLFFFFFLMR